jgi:hypothetical protein
MRKLSLLAKEFKSINLNILKPCTNNQRNPGEIYLTKYYLVLLKRLNLQKGTKQILEMKSKYNY